MGLQLWLWEGWEDTALAGLGVSTGTGVALPTEEAWANRAGMLEVLLIWLYTC